MIELTKEEKAEKEKEICRHIFGMMGNMISSSGLPFPTNVPFVGVTMFPEGIKMETIEALVADKSTPIIRPIELYINPKESLDELCLTVLQMAISHQADSFCFARRTDEELSVSFVESEGHVFKISAPIIKNSLDQKQIKEGNENIFSTFFYPWKTNEQQMLIKKIGLVRTSDCKKCSKPN